MLIDLYYYRKRIMKRWKSIKRYQRIGKIKPKITKGEYPSYQIPVSPNPPRRKQASLPLTSAEKAVKEGLCNSELDYLSNLNTSSYSKKPEQFKDRKSYLEDKYSFKNAIVREGLLLSEEFKKLLIDRNVKLAVSGFGDNDVIKIKIEYKGHKKEIYLTDYVSRMLVEDSISKSLDEIDRQINNQQSTHSDYANMSHMGIDLQKPYKSYSEYKYK